MQKTGMTKAMPVLLVETAKPVGKGIETGG